MIKYLMLMSFIVSTLSVSTATAQSDSLSTKAEDSTLNEIGKFHIIFGAGISSSTNTNWWEYSLPAMMLGTEISTSKTHSNAVQIFVQSWMFNIKNSEFSSLPMDKLDSIFMNLNTNE